MKNFELREFMDRLGKAKEDEKEAKQKKEIEDLRKYYKETLEKEKEKRLVNEERKEKEESDRKQGLRYEKADLSDVERIEVNRDVEEKKKEIPVDEYGNVVIKPEEYELREYMETYPEDFTLK